MDFCLVGINASYIHTSLAVRSVASYCKMHSDISPEFLEFTINQHEEDVLYQLFERKADVYAFSCYIWNIDMVKNLASSLSKILPMAKIFFAGPEATYKASQLIKEEYLLGIVLGEGEETTTQLFKALKEGDKIEGVAGLQLKNGKTEPREDINMNILPFAYTDLHKLDGRILYYESMRGCPFSCSYCLSSVERGVRKRTVDGVKADLTRFLIARPNQVKFVDRTFNCDAMRAYEIWEFLIANDNGVTNFHFELAGDLLNPEMLELLSTARPNLFQFEIGVQSTNPETLKAINRVTNLEKLKNNVEKLQKHHNIHLHLDLIVGLPFEGFQRFKESFNWVYSLNPHQFQVGFLKVLGGSQMEAEAQEFQLLYTDYPPFQILNNKWITYEEISLLEGVASMVDTYRNSGRFTYVTGYLIEHFSDPYDFYEKLYRHYVNEKGKGPLSKIGYYDILGTFAEENQIKITEELKTCVQFDIMLHEKPGRLPNWAQDTTTKEQRQFLREFYEDRENIQMYLPGYADMSPNRAIRVSHGQIMKYNPITAQQGSFLALFDYKRRDILDRAKVKILEINPEN